MGRVKSQAPGGGYISPAYRLISYATNAFNSVFFLAFFGFFCYLIGMLDKNKSVNGFITKVNIVDRKSGKIIDRNVMMKCEHHASIEDLNKDLAKFNLPRKFELVEWVA